MDDLRIEWKTVVSELFAENAHILHLAASSECIIVDPGSDTERIIATVEQQNLEPLAIVNTHGHADHIVGNQGCKHRWPAIPLVIGSKDADKLTDPRLNLSAAHGFSIISPPADQLLNEGDCYQVGGMKWDIYETPGHSVGHIILVCRQPNPWIVLGGDVLFQGGIGRTDFPDGSFQQLMDSIAEKLLTLPDDTIVLTGHGEATTIGHERASNPFL